MIFPICLSLGATKLKLDNITQITTSEILVKAGEGVPRGTEEQRDRGTGRLGDGEQFSPRRPVPRSPGLPVALKAFHVERMMFNTYL